MQEKVKATNPLIGQDYPDPDVIRVDDTYYMVSTTMHFMPGAVLLRSYDLVHWEIVGYLYDTLDNTPDQRLIGEGSIYGKGMWAASLRYHKGEFYVCFVANDTHLTYLYRSRNIEGPWTKKNIRGFYHDCSLFFDDDDRVYLIYGNTQIHLTELDADLNGPKEGGLDRIIVEERGNKLLGYEGTHFYKIGGRYYAFFIHSVQDEEHVFFRTEACFSSDSLTGEFTGGDVLRADMGYRHSGVAQGGIVDTPDGDWYAVLFQDRGAVGRIPVLVPVHWKGDVPVFGVEGKAPRTFEVMSTRPGYSYEPVYASDDFCGSLKKVWQWNHTPHNDLWSLKERPGHLRLYSGRLCRTLTESWNTLTQRMTEPASAGIVTVDGTHMKDGDFAGISAFQGCYGGIALTRENGEYLLVMFEKEIGDTSSVSGYGFEKEEILRAKLPAAGPEITLKCSVNFRDEADEARFFYERDGEWIPLGPGKRLAFKLDHFTGCRFGLFYYSTGETGGYVDFSHFIYEVEN